MQFNDASLDPSQVYFADKSMSGDCIHTHKDAIMKTIHTDPEKHEATRKATHRKRAHSPKRFLCIPYDVNSAKVPRR